MGTTPVVTIFVRHSADCKYQGNEFERRCHCRKHLRWTHNGTRYRRKAETRSWAEAEEIKRDLEDQLAGRRSETKEEKTIAEAVEVFIADKRIQGVSAGVLGKYARELKRLRDYAEGHRVFTVAGLTRELLIGYHKDWERLYPSSATRSMVQARLKGFLKFCFDNKWIERVPRLSPIKAEEAPTLPLTADEYQRLLDTIPVSFPDVVHVPGSDKVQAHSRAAILKNRAARVRALVRLMRHTGLAISDAVTLERSEVQRDAKGLYRVTTARQKTGTHVSVPIPPDVAQELLAAANGNPRYVFWTGNGEERTAVSHWQDDFRRLFRDAGISGEGAGNMVSHRLRDTFACDLLEKGVPLEEVSKLLGHESIRTTERSYAKWIKGRQDRLDSLVVGTWTQEAEKV